jgi:hypothetical protein
MFDGALRWVEAIDKANNGSAILAWRGSLLGSAAFEHRWPLWQAQRLQKWVVSPPSTTRTWPVM